MKAWLFFALSLFAALAAEAQTLPPGWSSQPAAADAPQVFRPKDLTPGEDTAVIYYPRTSLSGATVEKWLEQTLKADAVPAGGTWTGAAAVEPKTANLASATRVYRDAAGKQGFALYLAVTIDRQMVRLARWTASSEQVARRYQPAAQPLMQQVAALEKAGAVAEQRGTAIDAVPPKVDNVRAGGPLVSGRYAGNLLNPKGEILVAGVEMQLFDNGEWIFGKRGGDSGRYTYEPGTGKLDATKACHNNKYDPDEEFCLFGKDTQGKPVIYSHREGGFGAFKTLFQRVGDVDGPSPSEDAAAKKAAQAEARRYKWVTSPGQGLRADEIETILYVWEQVYEIGGLQLHESAWLLLKDGTVRDGLPVVPQDMDVAVSKRREPEKWGRWKRDGIGYSVAWHSKPDEYRKVSQGIPMQRGRDGTTLEGTFSGSSSYAIPGGGSSWSKYGVKFSADGRFERFKSGGAMAGGPGSGFDTMVSSNYDDKGVVSSSSAPGFAGGSERKTPDQGDRGGTYKVEGYALVLNYDNGTVVRLPFFTDAKLSEVWFEGSLLRR